MSCLEWSMFHVRPMYIRSACPVLPTACHVLFLVRLMYSRTFCCHVSFSFRIFLKINILYSSSSSPCLSAFGSTVLTVTEKLTWVHETGDEQNVASCGEHGRASRTYCIYMGLTWNMNHDNVSELYWFFSYLTLLTYFLTIKCMDLTGDGL